MGTARPIGRFPAAQRVRKRTEYLEAQAGGRRVRTPHFILLLYARGEGQPSAHAPARLGIIASRRIGKAVQRNRAKRLVREAFRATRDLWEPGIDLIVIVRSSLDQMKLDDVVAEWRGVAGAVRRRCRDAHLDRKRRDHSRLDSP